MSDTLRDVWKDLAIGTRAASVSHSTKREYVFIGWARHYAYFCEVLDVQWSQANPMIYRVSTVETARKVFPSLFPEEVPAPGVTDLQAVAIGSPGTGAATEPGQGGSDRT